MSCRPEHTTRCKYALIPKHNATLQSSHHRIQYAAVIVAIHFIHGQALCNNRPRESGGGVRLLRSRQSAGEQHGGASGSHGLDVALLRSQISECTHQSTRFHFSANCLGSLHSRTQQGDALHPIVLRIIASSPRRSYKFPRRLSVVRDALRI